MKLERTELINICRYYKGEEENPYKKGVPYYLWITEHEWVERAISDAKSETYSNESSIILEEYRRAGLIDFEKDDDVWLGLKATLYRLLQHWSEGMVTSEEWKKFYNEWKNVKLQTRRL